MTTTLALVLLGLAAVAPLPLSHRKVVPWLGPAVELALLAGAAIAAAYSPKVTGVEIGTTLAVSVAAAAIGGMPLAPQAFRIARRQPDTGGLPAPSTGPLRGGRAIGVLERTAVAAAVLAGKGPEGIAIVMVVKGLARYPELRDPTVSEQFIIGTFTSVLWAVAVAAVGKGMLT